MPKTRKMLSDWKAPYIQSLMMLIETQSKETLANWVIAYCEAVMQPLWQRDYLDDLRPQRALTAAREWLAGTIKLPQAKKEILACHGAARDAEGNPVAQAAARAIGQSASTIHSARHCIGLAFYGAPWQSPMISSGQRQAGKKLNNVRPQNVVGLKPLCVVWQWRMNRTRRK